jgi:hypothetical protein
LPKFYMYIPSFTCVLYAHPAFLALIIVIISDMEYMLWSSFHDFCWSCNVLVDRNRDAIMRQQQTVVAFS